MKIDLIKKEHVHYVDINIVQKYRKGGSNRIKEKEENWYD